MRPLRPRKRRTAHDRSADRPLGFRVWVIALGVKGPARG
jgi:hypothetical protein